MQGFVALQRTYGEPRRCGFVYAGVSAQPCGDGIGIGGGADAKSRPLANLLCVITGTAALKVILQIPLARDGERTGNMVDDGSGHVLQVLWKAAFPLEVLE